MMKNMIFRCRFITMPVMSAMVWPLWRREITRAPRSWTAPMKIEPRKTQSRAGTQPQMMPMAGPTMGPVPAMEVKWWPKMTCLRVGTKSTPSLCSREGVTLSELRPKTLRLR